MVLLERNTYVLYVCYIVKPEEKEGSRGIFFLYKYTFCDQTWLLLKNVTII